MPLGGRMIFEKQYAHFFDPKKVSYFGQFQGDQASILEKEVDLQINYFNRNDLYMEWVSAFAKKKFSAGFSRGRSAIKRYHI